MGEGKNIGSPSLHGRGLGGGNVKGDGGINK